MSELYILPVDLGEKKDDVDVDEGEPTKDKSCRVIIVLLLCDVFTQVLTLKISCILGNIL